MMFRNFAAALALATLSLGACTGSDGATSATKEAARTIPLTITSANGKHDFVVEVAKTSAEQERGLMYRTNIPKDGGMIFAPYPPEGGPPREATLPRVPTCQCDWLCRQGPRRCPRRNDWRRSRARLRARAASVRRRR